MPINKFDFQEEAQSTTQPAMPRRKSKKPLMTGLAIFAVFLVFVFVFIVLPVMRIKAKADVLVAGAKELKEDVKKNDIDLVKNKLNSFSTDYASFEKEAQSIYWLSFIPYVSDFKNGVEAGDQMLAAGREGVEAIYPYADLIGFKKGEGSFIEKSAENRLQTAVITLDKVLTKVDTISAHIDEAEKHLSQIDPNRYPGKIGNKDIRGNIMNLQEQFKGVSTLFVDSKPLLKKLPEIFGKDKEKTYLVLFQNDKEQRATGGFLTAYAIFKIKDGKITIDKSSDIYTLDDSIGKHPPAPDKILTYHLKVNQFFIRDSNLSPDFVESIKLFNSLYANSSEKVNYDGIISIDTHILVDMLTIFGDTEADGITFSAKPDKRCDCPEVIYSLFDMVDRPVNYIKTNRKGVLGELMYALFYKAIGFSPSKYWGTLTQTMLQNMEEKHILLYFKDPEIQASVEKLNYAGRIRDTAGDYLHVNNVNFAGAKSNLFVSSVTTSKTTFENGQIKREVMVQYKNPYPASDCNLERGGLCLNAPLRDWVRVYVPKGSKLVSFKGSSKPVQTYDDLGKTVFEGFLVVNPEGTAQIMVDYTLPSTISEKDYTLMIQKQPGTYGDKPKLGEAEGKDRDKLKVEINGKTVYNDIFDTDKQL